MSKLPFEEVSKPTVQSIDDVLANIIEEKNGSIISSLTLILKLNDSEASTVNNEIIDMINKSLLSLKNELGTKQNIRQPDISDSVKKMLDNIDFKGLIGRFASDEHEENRKHIVDLIKASFQSPLTVAIHNSGIYYNKRIPEAAPEMEHG